MSARRWLVLAVLAGLAGPVRADEAVDRALAVIEAVGREGAGNAAAAAAWQTLVGRGLPALMPTLAALRDDRPTAANWLRTAVQAIAEAERAAGRQLPADALGDFVRDTRHAGIARRLAYELLAAQDPAAAARLLPAFVDDPNPDLRRDAIAAELERIELSARADVRPQLERLFAASRDKDQVELIARKLAEHGGRPDVTAHFGFVTAVELLGPFDAPDRGRFETVYPPEQDPRAAGPFPGKDGTTLRWRPVVTADRMGVFDLNKLLGKHKDAVAYARIVVLAERDWPVEVRVTSPTSVKIFLNGRELFGRDEYHHGLTFDGNTGRGTLKKGENVILLKVCQNNQKEDWAQRWQFQVRLTDTTGAALPVRQQVVADDGTSRFEKLGYQPASAPRTEDSK